MGTLPFGTLLFDLRAIVRSLLRDRTVTLLAVVTLALGIGANGAIFSVVNGALLAPLPYPEAERLVQVWNTYPLMGLPEASVSVPDYFDRRAGVDAFEESALYGWESVNLVPESGTPEQILTVGATHTLFPLLEARPVVGRVFGADEDEPGNDAVVVLSHALWQQAFGGERSVVGRTVVLDGVAHRVIGVLGPEFEFPHPDVRAWTPFAPTPEQRSDESRGHESYSMVARLAPGATVEQAQSQIDAIHAANRERFPQVAAFWENAGFGGLVVPLRDELFGSVRPILLLLQGMVLLVLLIACANVANLLLTRLAARRKEMAVRSALGASGGRLAGRLLLESAVLGLVGGGVGLGLGLAGVELLAGFDLGSNLDRLELGLDPVTAGFCLAVSLVAGLATGLVPALTLRSGELGSVLREEGRTSSDSRGSARLRRLLVAAEVAMALVLLVGAGLLVRTIWALQNEDPGFEAGGVLTAQIGLPEIDYPQDERVMAFYDDVLERLRALPGVTSAGLVSSAPFSGSSSSGSYRIDGREPTEAGELPHALIRVVDEGYFETMGIQLLAGETFDRFDDAGAGDVVVVDRRLVDTYFPDGGALGARINRGGQEEPRWRTIIGVVEPVKVATLERPVTKETIYMPMRQSPQRAMTVVVRSDGDPAVLADPVREAVLGVDPTQPVFDIQTMDSLVGRSLRTRRASMGLLVLFGALALVLAAVGLYGVLSVATAQRRREIGTRLALGAGRGSILRLVVGQGLAMVLVGLAVGAVASLGLSRFLAAQLHGVEPWDPLTLGAVAVLLLAVATFACWWPARRAASVDPMEALREG